MNNLFAQSRSHWVRYDRYEIKTGKDGKRYITPEKTAKPDVYNPLKESSEMVLEALNVGMLMMNRSLEDEVEKAIMAFVTHYGLLGLMTALPNTPSFMDYEAVYLPKNHFIKEESMATEDYLALFYPFDELDVVKKGVESNWNVSNDRTMIALTMTFMDEPMAKNMSFQREYAEPYDWVAQQFKDWAFTLTTSILYYNDYDSIDEDTRNLYRKAMAAFGGIAPTYHIELLEKPTIYWDFHSLLLGIQMMFSFMLVDDAKPLRLCKHCQKVFLGARISIMSIKHGQRAGRIKTMDENMALTPYETREILFYKTDNGDVKVEILLYQENLWLTQAKMAELFEVQKAAISKHLKNIFASGELREDSVVSVLETTAADGKNYPTRYYNLDAIIAVGYRVNSKKATMFRIWANRILKEYIIKGYVMDDERLKEPQNFFGKDYFEEQLERIRDIRASERRFYQKITDIYSQCSADYDVDSPVTKEFFATVQNKLHYAITKHTAAEIIYDRADSTKPNMGLTTWKNAPSGRIRKSDVVIAKNYLDETEMGNLNEIVTMYLDYAERQARRGNIMYMQDWVARLDAFLQFNEEEVLHHKGKVTAAIAKAFAESEFEKYRVIQDRQYQSDFDRLVASTEEKD